MQVTRNRNPTGRGGFKDNPNHRNKAGQRNKAAVAFARTLRELIVKEGEERRTVAGEGGGTVSHKKIEWVVKSLYAQAFKGNMQAIAFIAERVEGKVKEELEHQGALVVRIEREGSQFSPADIAPGTGPNQA